MKNFTYRGKETSFLYTFDDLDVVRKYDEAEKRLNAILKEQESNIDMVERLKTAAHAMTIFVDELLGDGACNNMFGEATTITEVIKLKNTIVAYVVARITEENTAIEKIENREQRRAKK